MDILLLKKFDVVSLRTISREAFEMGNGKQQPVIQLFTEGTSWSEERTESVNEDIRAGKLDLREMITCMAGPEAEKILIGKIDDEAWLGAEGDVQGIVACCRAAISPGVQIENWRDSVMEEFIVAGVAMQANELLMDNWPSVRAVAYALLEREYLSFSEVEECILTEKAKVERKAKFKGQSGADTASLATDPAGSSAPDSGKVEGQTGGE
jgi:hypothetical protein